jgi:hypothetical protein
MAPQSNHAGSSYARRLCGWPMLAHRVGSTEATYGQALRVSVAAGLRRGGRSARVGMMSVYQ